jgi:DNA-binding response OmpR family regulator
MPAICPKCHTTLQLEQFPLRKDVHMTCTSCQAALTLSLVVTLESPSSVGDTPSAPPSILSLNNKKVVSLVEGDATNEMIQDVMSEGGFELIAGKAGQDIIAHLTRERPGIVIVDVGIPEVLGFEIADRIRKRGDIRDIGVILLASIHDKTRYKREPESLYGADDYIERHHIQDQLLPKIHKILESRMRPGPTDGMIQAPTVKPPERRPAPVAEAPPAPSPMSKAAEQAMSIENVFDEMMEEERKEASSRAFSEVTKKSPVKASMMGDPAVHEAAKRLARIIMSDIALYNQRAVEEGVRKGSIDDILHDELEEGKKLYEGRVPPEILSSSNYYREAIDDFVQKRKLDMQKRG